MSQSILYIMSKPPAADRPHFIGCRATHGLDDSYPPDRLHSTMLKLGNWDLWRGDRLERLKEVLEFVWFPPFDVTFDQLEGRLLRGARGTSAAAHFHRALRAQAALCGVPLPEHNFWLHMTLAYKGFSLDGPLPITPIAWRVEEFQLIRSITGEGDEEIGCWPLINRQFELAL